MKSDLGSYWSSIRPNGIFFLFLFSLYVGQGLSYGPVCLFHFTVPLFVLSELKKGISFTSFGEKTIWPFHLFFLLVCLSSFINEVHWAYLYYYSFGYVIFLLIWLKKDFIHKQFKVLLFFFGLLLALDLTIGLLEFLTPFRYPISKISAFNHFFGRDYSIFGSGSECFDMDYVLSSPTGFHWNQNNYALVLLIFLPFLRRFKDSLVRNLLRTLILLLILSTGSRLGFSVASFMVIVSVVVEYKFLKSGILPLLFLLVVYTDGFYYFPLGSKKVKEVALISKSEFKERFPEHCYTHENSENSRKELFMKGVNLGLQKPVIGFGAGGFTNEMLRQNTTQGNQQSVVNAHNYLIELFVDFGLIGFIPLFWIGILLTRGMRRLDRTSVFELVLFGAALLTGTLMVSSLVYFIPVYLSFFLLFIKVCSKHQELEATNS